MTEDSSVLELKADMNYCLREGLKDLAVAHQRRLAEEEKARLATQEATRRAQEAARVARETHFKKILMDHTDRFLVSIDHKLVKPRAGLVYHCTHGEAKQIPIDLMDLTDTIFPKARIDNFSETFIRPPIMVDRTLGCGCHYRAIVLPY